MVRDMSLLSSLRALATQAAGAYVRYDRRARVLSVGPTIVEAAVHRALARSRQVRHVQVGVDPTAVWLQVEAVQGFKVGAHLVPRVLELHGDLMQVQALAPRGVKVEHRDAAMGAMLGVLDGILGMKRVVGFVPGLRFEHDVLHYERAVGDSRFIQRLREVGGGMRERAVIEMDVVDRWLRLDLSRAVPPDFHLDAGRLLSLVSPGK